MRLNPKKNITAWGRISGPGLSDWLRKHPLVWITPFEIVCRIKLPDNELLTRRFKISEIIWATWISPDGRLRVKVEGSRDYSRNWIKKKIRRL